MSKRIFTQEQINLLQKNKNVLRCSEKSITYHKDFKIAALGQYRDGLTANEIFKRVGFDLAAIGNETPRFCLRRWRSIFEQKGQAGFEKEARGGPGRRTSQKNMSDKERLKYYETQITYLKAENAFLAKLRKRA